MSAKDGGAAFPSPGVVLTGGSQQGAYEGMSLRDWFAGHALCMVVAHGNEVPIKPSVIAGAAYAVADAMLAESRKP